MTFINHLCILPFTFIILKNHVLRILFFMCNFNGLLLSDTFLCFKNNGTKNLGESMRQALPRN